MNRPPFAPGRRQALIAAAAGAATLATPWVRAQGAWPAKPVTVIVPFPPGGGTDAFARPLFAALGRNLNRQFVIDNKGGAGGTLGAGIAAKSAPDGYTFFMGAVHHAIAPSMYPKLDYSIQTDFVPVGLIASVPQVIVVNPQRVQATTLPELLEFIRKNPAKLNYGSAGNGTSHHLAGELFKLQTKTFITHIPYRGAGPALQDLIAGQVDLMFDGLGSSATHIKGGRLRGIAVASTQRAPGFPDLPTAAEGGVPTYKVATWYGLWAPKGTPREITTAMAAEMRKALNGDDLKASWTGLGTVTPNLFGEDFGRFVDSEIKRWADVVKNSGAKLD
ncbi:Tripartite tricarboxylate transporter substrate binding protein [Rubrivivax sp. A210]|uniref:Bug family tripartite tricarboxylate transporter substrate binding protein n=1 Tax=Rubrivivax sp. A210 TaxID=2772301 RepID=UPI00191AFE3A|nr:tripartite tricarboxylate transporter substrate binding protein [Rubrivivax sp. A210]CAD5374127.1 Tripartite tricarboxylate transporter substrate binding protein [Rubrivivax sp. A210]